MRHALALLVAVGTLGATPVAAEERCPARCADGVEKLQVAPWGASVEVGVGIGFFFATHASLRFGIGRRFWDRLELEAVFQLVTAERLLGLGGALRAGLILHLSRRWELLLGWRVGYARFEVTMPIDMLRTGGVVVSCFLEGKVFLARHQELRIAPFVATGYWNRIWGFVAEPTIGYAYRF
jgi:hypothetical protein